MKKLALALLLLVIAPQAHAEENDSAEREFGGRKSAPDEPAEPSAPAIEPMVGPKPTTTVTAPAPAPTALAPEAKQPEVAKPKATYVCRKELSNNRKASAVQTCAVPVATNSTTQVVESKVEGLFGLSVGGHRGPKNRIPSARQDGNLSVLGGFTVGVTKKFRIGLIGQGRFEQPRGIGSMTFTENRDFYEATIGVAPIMTFGDYREGANAYLYAGPGIKANITFAEVLAGSGIGYRKGLFGVNYDVIYRGLRDDYDQFGQRLEGSIHPAEMISLSVNVHHVIVNPSDEMAPASRQEYQWGVGGGIGVGVHFDALSLKATGNVSSHAGLNGVLEITRGLPLFQ